jgi:NTE family protein
VKTRFYIIVLLCLIAAGAAADTTGVFVGWDGSRYNHPGIHHRLGLALSGGGARGLAQVGVIKALEEAGLQIEAIAGTSIGGIIGGLYASGLSADSLEKIIKSINFPSLFSDRPSRTSLFLTQRPEKERYLLSVRFAGFMPYIPRGLTAGQKLTDLISRLTLKANYTSGGSFMKMSIPFRAVTTDIVSGKEVIIESGNLADAMRSTMAFPLAFTGIEKGDMILMDGGMLNPIPVDAVRSMKRNLDLVIAVNTTSDLLPKNKIRDPIDIANQVTSIMTLDKKEAGLKAADMVITPDIADLFSFDFDRAEELIERGYQAGKKAIPEILARLNAADLRDSMCLTGVRWIDPPFGLDSQTSLFTSGSVIRRSTIEETAAEIYRDWNLFSVAIEVTPGDSLTNGCQTASLEIRTVSKPRLQELQYRLSGNTVFSDSAITGIIRDGRTHLSSEDIVQFTDSLRRMYQGKKYDLAHMCYLDFDTKRTTLDINIDEAVVERIEIEGNQRTKNWLIRSNFPVKEGLPLNSDEAIKGIANIYSTGLFDRATMNILPADRGAIVKINVEERKYTQMRLGWHWDDEYKSEEFAEILDDNLFGTGQELLLHGQYAPRRQKYEATLKADRFFSTYLTYRVKGYLGLLERNLYDRRGASVGSIREDRRGFEFALGQQISRLGSVTGEIKWEEIRNIFRPSGGKERIRLRTLMFRSLVETLNRYSFPTNGKKHFFFIEYAADILGGQTQYTKIFSSIESYFPISSRINIHSKISIGWTGTDHSIPVSEKFYFGGQYSFSGYRTDELQADKMILGNLELRYKLPYRLYLTGRYDIGEAYASVEQIKLRNLRHGFGISLAYDSPIGPIDFGYGRAGHHPEQYYVNIGLPF